MAKIAEAFYFGPESAQLFGAWYPPDPSAVKTTGVVVCPHMGQEGHLLWRRLAAVLSGCGYPVLRFDYFGTGDSSGESRQATIDQWLDDIGTAVGEMERRAGCSGICLVGLRFGGTLALLYGSRRHNLRAIAGLNPVTCGREYVAELRDLEREAWTTFGDAPAERLAAEQARSLMGVAYAEHFLADLEAIDLMSLKDRPADHIALFDDRGAAPPVSDLSGAPAFAGGFNHLEAGTRTDSIFGDDHWTSGKAPRNVSEWLLATCP